MGLYVDIEKRMGDFHLEVQFQAERETLALLGASGCGKSVTLKCVAGILTPDKGRITLDGVTLFDSAARIDLPPQKRRVGYLFQQYALFPNMTVRQNIAAAVRDRKTRTAATEEKLRQFQLEAVADLRPAQLSGGQQQRCALARILASEPGAILLDEPFSALDSYLKYQLELELWETLSAFPGPVVWVSHDRGEVLRNCPKVCVMDHGRSQAVRPMADLMARPGTEAAARLSGCENFADAAPQGDRVHLPAWGVTLACEQQREELVSDRSAYLEMLGKLTGTELDDMTLIIPDEDEALCGNAEVSRPEIALYDAQMLQNEAQLHQINSKISPKFNISIQGGIGRPGLNILKNTFQPYYTAGIRMSWDIGALYTRKDEKRKLDAKMRSIESDRETFMFNTSLNAMQMRNEIDKARALLEKDREIIALQASIREAGEEQYRNGVISMSDLMTRIDDEYKARTSESIHRIQLLMAIYDLKNCLGYPTGK